MKISGRKFAERLPDEFIAEMHAHYLQTKSMPKTAAHFGRKAVTLYRLFKYRGLPFKRKPHLGVEAEAMYADYLSGLSLEQVGQKWRRSRQSLFDTFKRRGYKLRGKVFQPVVEYRGRRYTSQKVCGRHRYLRDTVNRSKRDGSRYLHHVIWEEHNGPIPPGFKVCFKDGNHLNCAIENLELLSNSAQVRKHATGANQFTRSAQARLGVLLNNGAGMAVEIKRRAA